MVVKNLYKYSDGDKTVYSCVEPGVSFQPVFRLIPAEGKTLYNGELYRACIDVTQDMIDSWSEVDQIDIYEDATNGGESDDLTSDESGSV